MSAIDSLIAGVLSGEPSQIKQCESTLLMRGQKPQFLSELLEYSADCHFIADHRKFALVNFQNTVQQKWTTLHHAERNNLCNQLSVMLQSVIVEEVSVQNLALDVVSSVASLAVPGDWPDFVSRIGNCPEIFVLLLPSLSARLELKQLHMIVPVVGQLLASFQVLDDAALSQSLNAVSSFLVRFGLNDDVLCHAIDGACCLLLERLSSFATAAAILKFFDSILLFSRKRENFVTSQVVEYVLHVLLSGSECSSNFLQLVHFLNSLVGSEFYHSVLQEVALSGIYSSLIPTLVNLVRFPPDLTAQFLVEQDQAIAYEEEFISDNGNDVRQESLRLIVGLSNLISGVFLSPLLQFCNSVLVSDFQESGWLKREAVLSVISVLILRSFRELQENGMSNMEPLCKILLSVDVSSEEVLLTARALSLLLIVLRKKEKVLSLTFRQQLLIMMLVPAVQTLSNSSAMLISCSANLLEYLLGVHSGIDRVTLACEVEKLTPQFAKNVANALGGPVCTEVLHSLLHILSIWIPLGRNSDEFALAPEFLLNCWCSHMNDPDIADYIAKLFQSLSRCTGCQTSLMIVIRRMKSIVERVTDVADLCCVPSVLNITRLLLKNGDENIATEIFLHILPAATQLVLTCDENAVTSSGLLFLASSLQRLGSRCAQISLSLLPSSMKIPPALPQQHESPLLYSLKDVCLIIQQSVLSSEKSELSLLNCGKFLCVVRTFLSASFSDSDLALYISSIVNRCETVNTDLVLQELVLPIMEMLCLNTLSTLRVLGAKVKRFFGKVLNRAHLFSGANCLKACADGLRSSLSCDELCQLDIDMKLTESKRARSKSVRFQDAVFIAVGRIIVNVLDDWSDDEFEDVEDSEDSDDIPLAELGDDDYPTARSTTLDVLRQFQSLIPRLSTTTYDFFPLSQQKQLSDFFAKNAIVA